MTFAIRRRGILGAALLAVACSGTTQQSMQSADPAPIREVREKYQAAYNAADAVAVVALYTDDAVSLADHHLALEGKPAIQNYLEGIYARYGVVMTFVPIKAEVTGDLGYEHGTYTIKVTPKAGGETVNDDGKYVMIFKRGADGAWKIRHDMDNSNRPPS
jgi:uncharacterized protein (TIGR02246 family)